MTWSRLAVVSVVHFSKAPSPIVVVEVVLVVVKDTLEALMLVNAPSAIDIPTWMVTVKVPVPKISTGEYSPLSTFVTVDDEPLPVVSFAVVSSESPSDDNVTLERVHVLPHPLLPSLLLSESNPVAIVFVPLDPAVIFSVVPSNSQLTPEPIVPDAS